VLNGEDVRQAEIKPVEPEQGNACAGKVKSPLGPLTTYLLRSISQINFFSKNQKRNEKIVLGDVFDMQSYTAERTSHSSWSHR
jgi:hypothetical protein